MSTHLRSVSLARRLRFASRTPTAVVALFVIATAARAWLVPAAGTKQQEAVAAPTVAPTVTPSYVRRPLLPPQLLPAFIALGDRLEKPGQERITLLGTLNRPRQRAAPAAARLILEYPDLMRLEEAGGSQVRITLVNSSGASALAAPLGQQEADEVESLLLDSADHFFAARMKGLAMRALGAGFRLDDGTTVNYSGPFYDIYQMYDQVALTPAARVQPKFYYFNSRTQLLERVHYDLYRGGSVVKAETRIGGWQKVSGQLLPTTITRLENGEPTLALNITAAAVSPHLNDTIFVIP